MSRRFWIYLFTVRTVYGHKFTEKLCCYNRDVIFLRPHVYAKKIQGLFNFKIKIYLFLIKKSFLKNSNNFFHFLWRLRRQFREISFFLLYLSTLYPLLTLNKNFYIELLVYKIKCKDGLCTNDKPTLLVTKFLHYARITSERLSRLLLYNIFDFCQSTFVLLKKLKW